MRAVVATASVVLSTSPLHPRFFFHIVVLLTLATSNLAAVTFTVLPPFDPGTYVDEDGDQAGYDTFTHAVSGDGSTIVGHGAKANGGADAFRWKDGVYTTVPFAYWGRGNDIFVSEDGKRIFGNNVGGVSQILEEDGTIVPASYGDWVSFNREIQGKRSPLGGWTGRWDTSSGNVQLIDILAISDDFSTAVGDSYNEATQRYDATIWKGGRAIILRPSDHASGGTVTGVSGDGSVACGYFRYDTDDSAAGFVWTEADGVVLIRDLIRAQGLIWHDSIPLRPTAVSSDGTVVIGDVEGYIAGYAEGLATENDPYQDMAWHLELDPSPIRVKIEPTEPIERALKLDEEITVRLTATARASEKGPLKNVAFSDPVGLEVPENFEVIAAPDSTTIGQLDPGEVVAFEWTLRVKKRGKFEITNSVINAIDHEGRDVVSNIAAFEGKVSAFLVDIVYPEDPLTLERKEDDGDLDDPIGYEPLTFDVIVRVSVPEDGESIQDIRFQGFDASDGGLDIDLVEGTGLPEAPWKDVIPQPAPLPVRVTERSAAGVKLGVLKPGATPVDFVVKVTAERPGNYDMAALITAAPEGGGETLTERGNKATKIHGDLILGIQLEVVNKPARITEGEAVEITGVVENLTLDETIILDPLLVFSSGQGVPLGPVALDDDLPPPGIPGIFNPVLDPGQSERFRLRVQTVALPGFDQREMGRHSVVIDFGASGTVIDPEKKTRDLDEEAIIVEWGNGRHTVEGATFLRTQVDADLRPTQVLDPDTFFSIAAGEALENLAVGGGEALAAIPGLLASLPSTLWGVANFAGKVYVEKQIASHNAARYLWAWTDLQIDIWAGLDTSQREQNLKLLTDELVLYYGPQLESAEQTRQIINNSITDYFGTVIDYQKRAYDASGYGYNTELAAIVGEPFRPTGKFVVEEALAAAAVLAWTSRAPVSPTILDDVAEQEKRLLARSKQQANEATTQVARSGRDPRVTEMPDPMKALPASTPLTQKNAVDGWGMDPVSDRNLIKMTDVKNGGMPIFVAVRSRADETIEWMKTQLGITPKPMTFKPKNVNADDVKYLGYRDGVGYGDANGIGAGDRGATIIAEPLPRDEVLNRLIRDGADAATEKRVLERHDQRWKEWYGNVCCDKPAVRNSKATDLTNKLEFDADTGIGKGTLDVPRRGSVPQPDINADVVGPGILDARQFEMRQVKSPPDDDLFEGGRQYYECWLEDDLGTPNRKGTMRRIAGDIDTVAVGLADGSALPVATSFSETVAANILHGIQGQHPWSSSLVKKVGNKELDLFEEFVNNGTHRWHDNIAKRGEPLIIYVNGERRVGWFHPTRAITSENPLKNFVWLDGGTGDVNNVIKFQKDLRGSLDNPADINPPLVKPSTSVIREALLSSDISTGSTLIASCTIQTSRTSGTLYRLSRNTIFEKRKEDGTWEAADPTEGCGDDSGIVVWPETFMTDGVVSGTVRIPIIEDLLDFDWKAMFQIGDNVVIAPGTPKEETRRVTGHGSLILDRSLTFSHDMGTQIISLGTTAKDLDADGLSNEREAELGTNFILHDTDGDGIDDGTEVRRGTDPLVADHSPNSSGFPLSITPRQDGQIELRWLPLPTRVLEQSFSLQPGTWTPVQDQESGVLSINPFLGFGYFRLRDE